MMQVKTFGQLWKNFIHVEVKNGLTALPSVINTLQILHKMHIDCHFVQVGKGKVFLAVHKFQDKFTKQQLIDMVNA